MWREQMNDRNGWCDKGTKTSTKTAVLKLDMLMWDRKGISLSRKVVLLYYLGPSMAVASEGLKVMPLGNFWFCHVILLSPTWNSEAFAPEEMLPRSMRPSFFLRGIPWPLMKQLDADGHNMTCARSGYRRIPSLFIWMMLVSCSYRQGLFGCVFFR